MSKQCLCPQDRVAKLYPHVNEEETALPRSWSQQDKFTYLGLSQNNLRVHYKGVGKSHKDAASVRATHPIPAACGLYYFEVKIVSKGRDGYIGIGLCAQGVNMNKLPGWEKSSYGYHADDGHSFCSSGAGEIYGPTFSTGDIIGCGLNFVNNSCFYTKNGVNLGVAFTDLLPNLYPTVGLQTLGEIVDANFGQQPFVYDIDEMRKELCTDTMKTVTNFPIIGDDASWQNMMQKIVSAYLVHHGYCGTAEAFAKATSQSINEEPTSIRNRQRIQKLILSGRISEAIETTNALYHGLLERNSKLLFQLKCRQFIEMVNGTDGEIKPLAHSPTRSTRNSPTSSSRNSPAPSARNSPCASPSRTMSHTPTGSSGLLKTRSIDNSPPNYENGSSETFSNGVYMEEGDMDVSSDEYMSNGVSANEDDIMDTSDDNRPCSSTSLHSSVSQQRALDEGPSMRQLCGGNLFAIEKLISFGKSLQGFYQEIIKEHGPLKESETVMKEAFSLLAYNNPRDSPVGYLLDPLQRESVCAALNSAMLESQKLPGQPALELAIGQSQACLKTMAKYGIGSCAMIDMQNLFSSEDI